MFSIHRKAGSNHLYDIVRLLGIPDESIAVVDHSLYCALDMLRMMGFMNPYFPDFIVWIQEMEGAFRTAVPALNRKIQKRVAL